MPVYLYMQNESHSLVLALTFSARLGRSDTNTLVVNRHSVNSCIRVKSAEAAILLVS